MGIAASHAGEILSKDFGGVDYTPPATWYVGLLSGGVELSGGSYARVAVTNDASGFPTVTTNLIVNGVAITFPQATADWAQADEVGLWIASSGGSPKYTDDLDSPVTVRTGQTRSFAAGDLKIKLIPVIT
jgi:hypothetical protein